MKRRVGRSGPGTIRLWTLQPLEVWERLRHEDVLTVDPGHPGFCLEGEPTFREPYDWMREQMASRIEGFSGHYPWWAYEHFLDLRRYCMRRMRTSMPFSSFSRRTSADGSVSP